MRLFIAINLSDDMKAALLDLQNDLYDRGVSGRYTTEENLHLTLAFIGEYPDAEPVLDAMSTVSFKPFELALDGMGRFGDLYYFNFSRISPRVIPLLSSSSIFSERASFAATAAAAASSCAFCSSYP